jgi:hypothetical protein
MLHTYYVPLGPPTPQFLPPPPAPALQGMITQTVSGIAPTLFGTSRWDAAPPAPKEREMNNDDVQLVIAQPEDPYLKAVIDMTATFVAADGDALERTVKAREEGNPLYDFLFNSESPEGLYYRWRTYANILGEYFFLIDFLLYLCRSG